MAAVLSELAADVARQFSRDGVEVMVRSVDADTPRVDLALDLSNAECLDCVMPGDYLRRLIAEGLADAAQGSVEVTLSDPRAEAVVQPDAATYSSVVRVLDPTGVAPSAVNADPGPALGTVAGKMIGFRVDTLWRSWDWVADEWMKLLVEAGAEVRDWRRVQGIHGEAGEAMEQDYRAFLGSVDAVISGLGNCGSCTAWTVTDAMSGRATGLPSMAVVTEQFDGLSELLAQDGGCVGLRRYVLPYPLDTLPEDEVRAIARERFDAMLAAIGAQVA